MPLISRSWFGLVVLSLGFGASACSGCAKRSAQAEDAGIAPSASSSTPSADPSSTAPSDDPKAPPGRSPVKSAAAASAPATSASAASIASAPPTLASASAVASAAGQPVAAAAGSAPKSANADEIPKPCTDNFGRLGHLTFTDLGGGRVRVASDKNASAMCTRIAPTQYQCDWILDGKPTGSFVDKFDPAHKSVTGSIAKGKMFSCSGSSQN